MSSAAQKRALVIGASGGIGAAFMQLIDSDPTYQHVTGLHRAAAIPIDLADATSIESAAQACAALGPFQLIINAAGLLHTEAFMPEKKLADLNAAQLQATFAINTLGPALLLRHFTPLLAREGAVMAMLSAKVGSIGDNRLGGWYGYRASKAALNMLIKTAAIELRRTQPNTVLVALHPGTVNSRLSQPFRGAEIGRDATLAAAEMLAVLAALTPADSGSFISYSGERLPW
jgi:NAD(P)-dependent dehydrogenase (short-subunit alcohol dehydrogenase family)